MKQTRRDFLGTVALLMSAMTFPAPPKTKKGITLRFHDTEIIGSGSTQFVQELPHRNHNRDTYDVHENGFMIGELNIRYKGAIGSSCLMYRQIPNQIDFTTFFGLTVVYPEQVNFDEPWHEPILHDEKVVKKIAQKLLQQSIVKMEEMIKKFQCYKEYNEPSFDPT